MNNIVTILFIVCAVSLPLYASLPSQAQGLPPHYYGCTSKSDTSSVVGQVDFNEGAHEQCSLLCSSGLIGLVSLNRTSPALYCVCYNAAPVAINDELCVAATQYQCTVGSGTSLCGSHTRGSPAYVAVYENVVEAHQRSERGFVGPNNKNGPVHQSGPNNAHNFNGADNFSGKSNPTGETGKTGKTGKTGETGKTGINNYRGNSHSCGVSNTNAPCTSDGQCSSGFCSNTTTTGDPANCGSSNSCCQPSGERCASSSDCLTVGNLPLQCFPNNCTCENTCFTWDAPVLMANGSIARAEDVRLGDELMGLDGVNVVTYIKIGVPEFPMAFYGMNGRREYFTLDHPMYNPERSGPLVMDLAAIHKTLDAFHIPRNAVPFQQIVAGKTSMVAYGGSDFHNELVVSTTRTAPRFVEKVYAFATVPRDRVADGGTYVVDGLVNDGNFGKMSFGARSLFGPFVNHAFETFDERVEAFVKVNPGSNAMAFVKHVLHSLGASIPVTIQPILEKHSNGELSSENVAAWKQFYSGPRLASMKPVLCNSAAKEMFNNGVYITLNSVYAKLDVHPFSIALYNDLMEKLVHSYETI